LFDVKVCCLHILWITHFHSVHELKVSRLLPRLSLMVQWAATSKCSNFMMFSLHSGTQRFSVFLGCRESKRNSVLRLKFFNGWDPGLYLLWFWYLGVLLTFYPKASKRYIGQPVEHLFLARARLRKVLQLCQQGTASWPTRKTRSPRIYQPDWHIMMSIIPSPLKEKCRVLWAFWWGELSARCNKPTASPKITLVVWKLVTNFLYG
jgi:hypothetical protein